MTHDSTPVPATPETAELPAIELHDVGKAYRIYRSPGDRLREVFTRTPRHTQHWALREVNVAIARGETFGLVGENGAGKSTFLKLVAQTLRPSHGTLTVRGSVAALLELGAGFHPEESGFENIMLMGALNGVPRARLAEYAREVVEFSELPQEVIARPVKTYSSGMFMRLAFAAATAVDPDVLVIDEALSVGDMHFQKKSLDRIMGFRERGKTVLFCSHNLYQVRSLCQRAIWVDRGTVREIGDTESVVTAYESHERAKENRRFEAERATPVPGSSIAALPRSSLAPARLADVQIETPDGINQATIVTFQPVRIVFEIDCDDPTCRFHVGFAITRNDRENVFGSATHFDGGEPFSGAGRHRVAIRLPELPLLSGDYVLSVYVLDDTGLQVLDMAEGIRPFRVLQNRREFGFVWLPHQWERNG